MPIDYKKYPKDWKTVIRPAILTRAFNHCEYCNIKNGITVIRGEYYGRQVYQNDDGDIFDADTSQRIGADYVGTVGDKPYTTIVLTIAHLDNDVTNNDYANLRALCQRCHFRIDKELHQANSKATREAKKKQHKLF